MEKLNELKEAFYPQYGTPGSRDMDVTARRKVIDENIEAVADHIRALEQRAEDAAYAQLAENVKEIEASYLRDIQRHVKTISDLQQRAEAAEAHATEGWRVAHETGAECDQLKAKLNGLQDGFIEAIRHKDKLADELNELAKQDPVAWILHGHGGDQLTADGDYVANVEGMHGAHSTPLFTLPAPAADLAALVPDEWALDQALKFVDEYAPPSEEEAALFAANAFRATILRNIEEKS